MTCDPLLDRRRRGGRYIAHRPTATAHTYRESCLSQSCVVAGKSCSGRITLDTAVLAGKPVVRGSRLAVDFIVGLMGQGWTEADILRNYPGLTHDDIAACLQYASEILQSEKVYPAAIRLTMRLLADENFPGDAVTALRAAGHDVLWIRTEASPIKTYLRAV